MIAEVSEQCLFSALLEQWKKQRSCLCKATAITQAQAVAVGYVPVKP